MTLRSARTLPSGPRFSPLQMWRYISDPCRFYKRCAAQFGDVFTVPTFLGTVVVCGHPDGIRSIFSVDPDSVERFSTDAVAPLLGPHSVLLTNGTAHRKARKLLIPPFHAGRMHTYGAVIRDATLRAAERFQTGDTVGMQEIGSEISIDVILRAVFGIEELGLPELRRAVLGSMKSITPLLMLARFARRSIGGRGPWARFVRIRDQVDALTYSELQSRRARAAATDSAAENGDILSLLLEARYDDGSPMTDQEIRDQLLTLVFAGHETSGIALAWAVYWIDRTPPARERLLAELDSLGPDPEPDALASARYLGAVCAETLRLSPVVPEVIRQLRKPLDVCGFTVPAGVAVAASIVLAHSREASYPDAAAFQPERFLQREFTPFEYLPFGGGSRRCIGAAFALHEMKIVLGSLLSRFRLRVVGSVPPPALRNLTMAPAGGIPVRIDARNINARPREALSRHA